MSASRPSRTAARRRPTRDRSHRSPSAVSTPVCRRLRPRTGKTGPGAAGDGPKPHSDRIPIRWPDSTTSPSFRTDYTDRSHPLLRAGYTPPKKRVRAGITAERTTQSNDQPDIGYDARLRQYAGDVEVAPIDALHFRASISQFRADS